MTLGVEEIKQLLHQQIDFYRSNELREPNCCMLGLSIVTLLDGDFLLYRDEKTGGTYFEGLKLYLDGDDGCTISVGYNPFIKKQGIIL